MSLLRVARSLCMANCSFSVWRLYLRREPIISFILCEGLDKLGVVLLRLSSSGEVTNLVIVFSEMLRIVYA